MSTDPDAQDRENEAVEFDRLCVRALRGSYYPTFPALLQGVPFFKNDISSDADGFARGVMAVLNQENDPDGRLLSAMARLTASQEIVDFVSAGFLFQAAIGTFLEIMIPPAECAGRCWFYAAVCGDHDAARFVAEIASKTPVNANQLERAPRQLRAVLAWALAAAGIVSVPNPWTRDAADAFIKNGDLFGECFGELVQQTAKRRAALYAQTTSIAATLDREDTPADGSRKTEPDAEATPGVVVFASIGNPDTSEGRRVAHALRPFLGKRLKLIAAPDLVPVRTTLVNEFPHATSVIDSTLSPLRTNGVVQFRPTMLVGPPGCGKTSFAIRLAELLGVPSEVFPCGGVADSALSGTPRRWTSGEPSLPVSVVQSTKCANPLVILDEIEKASSSRHNGCMLDGLLALWEPRTARAWRDPYVEAPCDLSHVNWLGTANSLEGVPRAVRDRCRILRFPAPLPEHLPTLAFYVIRDFEQEDTRWMRPLDEVELAALEATWADGSLRSLTHLVRSVLDAREKFDARH